MSHLHLLDLDGKADGVASSGDTQLHRHSHHHLAAEHDWRFHDQVVFPGLVHLCVASDPSRCRSDVYTSRESSTGRPQVCQDEV